MLSIILIVLYLHGFIADDGPLVQTSLGQIKGYYKRSFDGRQYSAFEGIPYAKPPVGALRFEAPQPVSPWDNVLNASAYYVCKQPFNDDTPFGPNGDSEDCLYLNVYVPNTKPSEYDNYDVIADIHGGQFFKGSSAFANATYFMDRDVIVVNMNYRLGILGFLSTEDNIVPGNNGLKDQQMALKWIQSQIRCFGGNPNSVTLIGSSAGATAVHYHYFSPRSKGLFHRGISLSGNALHPWAMQKRALEKTRTIAKALNCQHSDVRVLINCLKAVDASSIVNLTYSFFDLFQLPISPIGPVVEVKSNSSFLTKHPYQQLKDGGVYDVPFLTWITKDEGMIVAASLKTTIDIVEKNWFAWSEHMFDYKYVCPEDKKNKTAQEIKNFYFKNKKISERNLHSLIEALGHRLFQVGFEISVKMQSKVSNSPIFTGIYGYKKTAGTNATILGIECDGVSHVEDQHLLHDVSSPVFAKPDILMQNVLFDFVTSFARDG